MLLDNHGRPLSYLRLAVTDRCNLRCFYCMPAEGISYLPKKELLSYEEMRRLVRLLAAMGIYKIRITGGEPFVRRDLIPFMYELRQIPGVRELHLTTNGVLTHRYLDDLEALQIDSVNLSLDSLDRARFFQITRRDELPQVLKTYEGLLARRIKTKINAVVMAGQNTEDLIPLAEMARQAPIEVRFIEEMPFNGEGAHYAELLWTYRKIQEKLQEAYPKMYPRENAPFATAQCFGIPGFLGSIGIIAAFSRTFCGTCNRIRITAQGQLKTCLYDEGVLNVRDLLRQYPGDDQAIEEAFLLAFQNRPRDGFEAEQKRTQFQTVHESMSTIGG
ncbi:MAG: GTP 3',8-cyclase MoaA [Microscillaceae bacterium]|nr:GTP 3',8-cyclase MoaA [Microscillaceae bacterium]